MLKVITNRQMWKGITRGFSSQVGKLLTVNEQECVKTITLNNPKTRNALSLGMMQQLNSELAHVNSDVKCVVLSAVGPVFSAGHNLKELDSASGIEHHKLVFNTCTELMQTIETLPVPLVCRVHALAAAAGCQLVAMSDIVVAAESATFSTPGINFGLFCSTPGVAVARAVPRKLALYMLHTGLPISANQALTGGLVSLVVPDKELDENVQKVVDNITNKSLPVTKLGKTFFKKQVTMELGNAYTAGGDVMVENLTLADGQEGITAFKEKRKPKWKE